MFHLLDGLLRKDENLLNNIFEDIVNETINLLEKFGERVQFLEEIFERDVRDKRHRLVKS